MVKENREVQSNYLNTFLQALYSNSIVVSASTHDIVINFGVSAPTINSDEDTESGEKDYVSEELLPLVRIFMTKSTAKDLAKQLEDLLKPKTPNKKEEKVT